MSETTEDLASLKAQADALGISYHPSIGIEKLREKLAAVVPADIPPIQEDPMTPAVVVDTAPTPAPVVAPVPAPAVETEKERRRRKKMEALALVRIRLTCLNPAKKEWNGEIITVCNRLVGTVAKFIPFTDADDGWHVPRILYDVLKDRQCQVFTTVKSKNGVGVRKGKLIKEFAIEVLPQLTKEELHDLAQRQAMAQSVG